MLQQVQKVLYTLIQQIIQQSFIPVVLGVTWEEDGMVHFLITQLRKELLFPHLDMA